MTNACGLSGMNPAEKTRMTEMLLICVFGGFGGVGGWRALFCIEKLSNFTLAFAFFKLAPYVAAVTIMHHASLLYHCTSYVCQSSVHDLITTVQFIMHSSERIYEEV